MALARPKSACSDEQEKPRKKPAKKPTLKRTKVLTTAMTDDAPAATKRVVKKPVKTKPVARKAAPKKSVAAEIAAPAPSESVWNDPREPRPERRSATERLDDPPPATGAELVERVSWAIERELNQIELIVGGQRVKPAQRTEAERRARTLASLARTLSEVARLRAQHQQRPDNDDDAMPRDLDEFRETLARRLEQLLAARSNPADGDVQPG